MGKKAKTKAGKVKANSRKVDKASLPGPPRPIEDEVGSKKLLTEPKIPGTIYKALDGDGYDDGGVGDLTLVIDLDDHILRRKRGDAHYFEQLRSDLLPRDTQGQLQNIARREQKIRLAKLLFSEEEDRSSEVYMENVADTIEDEATQKKREERLASAKYALRLSSVLREAACSSLSLSEISKRYLALGKAGAEDALRCAEKAVEIASDGFFDNDEIVLEAHAQVKLNPKYEKNATYHGLSHPVALGFQPLRVSQLCLRSAYLQMGSALSALGRHAEAREVWEKVLPLLADEPRCGRLDLERSSILLNVGNSYSREGNHDKAKELYAQAEKLGQDHLDLENGNRVDGLAIVQEAMRIRSFALKRAGKEKEAKDMLRKVLELQVQKDEAEKKQKAIEEEMQKEAEKKEAEKQLAAAGPKQ